MPLTAKEKMKRYRERLKMKDGAVEEVRQKDRERKKAKRDSMSEDAIKMLRERTRQNVRKHRSGKRKEIIQAARGIVTATSAFRTPQALGKAKRRVLRSLPASPRKRIAVVSEVASAIGIPAASQQKQTTFIGSRMIDEETKSKIHNFYLSTSWICPGKKDVVIIRSPGKKKRTEQKQYLLSTLKEAHAMYLEENPENNVSFSKFASMRPPQVKLLADVPHTQCLCRYHENVRLLLQALHKAGMPIVSTDYKSFIENIVCDQSSEECMTGKCTNCPGIQLLAPPDNLENKPLQWCQWASDEKKGVAKAAFQGSLLESFNELALQIPNFLKHTYVKRIQAHSFKEERESVNFDSEKVVIQIDFAENYSTVTQNEIQSAYWTNKQVTLFTVCFWEQMGAHSMIITSDYLQHDKYAVTVFIKIILEQIDSVLGRPISKHVFFSDGPSSQFKQRFVISSLTHLGKNIEWNFFATSHGKGPVDGIGGSAKRNVSLFVKAGLGEVNSAKDFTDVANKVCKKTKVILCPKEKIDEAKPSLDKSWSSVLHIPKIQSVHKFVVIEDNVVDVMLHSNSTSIHRHRFVEMKMKLDTQKRGKVLPLQ